MNNFSVCINVLTILSKTMPISMFYVKIKPYCCSPCQWQKHVLSFILHHAPSPAQDSVSQLVISALPSTSCMLTLQVPTNWFPVSSHLYSTHPAHHHKSSLPKSNTALFPKYPQTQEWNVKMELTTRINWAGWKVVVEVESARIQRASEMLDVGWS